MLGVSEMFLATSLLIDHNADGAFGDIPDDTGAAVVELVRHALVHGAVHLDVHIVADLVVAQVRRQVDVSFVSEGTREQIPGPRPQSMTGRHSCSLLSTSFLVLVFLRTRKSGGSRCEAPTARRERSRDAGRRN